MLRRDRLIAADPSHSWIVETYDETVSTNSLVKDMIKGMLLTNTNLPDDSVNVDRDKTYFAATSLVQTGGYGRQGRTWTSPRGGLYLSLGLPIRVSSLNALPTSSLVCALALKKVIESFVLYHRCNIKWPNDILVDSGKICGISLESVNGYLCIGIGLNVFHPKDAHIDSRYEVRYLADYLQETDCGSSDSNGESNSLCDQACSVSHDALRAIPFEEEVLEQLAGCILRTIGLYYDRWVDEGFSSFRSAFESCMSFIGSSVDLELIDGSSLVQGTICGIDENGRLVVEHNGIEQGFASGEVHVKTAMI